MSSRKHSTEQIIRKLREAEVELAKGRSIREVCKQLGVTEQTYYRWRKEYGGIRTDQARRLKELERENGRLKKVVADLTLDNVILKEAASIAAAVDDDDPALAPHISSGTTSQKNASPVPIPQTVYWPATCPASLTPRPSVGEPYPPQSGPSMIVTSYSH